MISSHTLLSAVERVARLIDVTDLHRFAEPERAGVGLLLPGDHPEQRRLAGAVRADHADDSAARQRERHVVHQQHVAVSLRRLARLDDDVAEPRTGRNVDLDAARSSAPSLRCSRLFVGIEARLPFRLPRARRHANPFELALQRPLALALSFLLDVAAASVSARARTSSSLPTESPSRDRARESIRRRCRGSNDRASRRRPCRDSP